MGSSPLVSTTHYHVTWYITRNALWLSFAGHKAYCFLVARIGLADNFRKNYGNRGENRQAQLLARIAIGCAFCLCIPSKTRDCVFGPVLQGNSHVFFACFARVWHVLSITTRTGVGYHFASIGIFSHTTSQRFGLLVAPLYSPISFSRNPLI